MSYGFRIDLIDRDDATLDLVEDKDQLKHDHILIPIDNQTLLKG